MTEIAVNVLQLKVVSLSAKIWKQIPETKDWQKVQKIIQECPDKILGWVKPLDVHGARDVYLLAQTGEGEYLKFNCLKDSTKNHKQIFLV